MGLGRPAYRQSCCRNFRRRGLRLRASRDLRPGRFGLPAHRLEFGRLESLRLRDCRRLVCAAGRFERGRRCAMTTPRALAVTSVLLAAALSARGALLTISPAAFQPPPGIPINQPFSVNLTATPTPAVACTWTISSGALPAGLAIAPGVGKGAATISGTPTVAGNATFTVTCTAWVDAGSRAYSLFVLSPVSISQTSIP